MVRVMVGHGRVVIVCHENMVKVRVILCDGEVFRQFHELALMRDEVACLVYH